MKQFMKNISCAVVLTAALLLATPAKALETFSVWAGGGTAVSTTLSYTVVSTLSRNGGQPRLTYLHASSDKSTSKIQFYNATTNTQENFTNSTVTLFVATNSVMTNTTTFFNTNSGIILIRHQLTDVYERRILTASTGTTNLVVTVAPTYAVIPGDQIWQMSTNVVDGAGIIPWGATTNSINGTGIFSGRRGLPLLIEIDGTTGCSLNAACATYDQ